MKEGWFLTELIYSIHNKKESAVYQFDKQMKMIKAASEREAYQFSLVLASKELDLKNTAESDEQWEFVGIGLFQMIDEPREVKRNATFHYEMYNAQDAKQHVISLRKRLESLQMQIALSA